MVLHLKIFVLSFSLLVTNCKPSKSVVSISSEDTIPSIQPIKVGAAQLELYLPQLKDKTIALVVNQTSTIGNQHLVDSLLTLGIHIKTIFAPEHGFREMADAGAKIADARDPKTQLPIVSLYGAKRKPTPADLKDIDLIIFDIQDVGARFYTYISSMHYVMEACAENNVDFMVLDRPNPNGHYVDGPILDTAFSSFVGMHPIPVVHGMTIGEYAKMVNGEGWLNKGVQCDLEVIPCQNYTHQTFYEVPIKPSPNLPNARAIYLYPSLCFFEGTVVNEGRGTNKQFQVYGAPKSTIGDYEYTPVAMPGAQSPKHQNKLCKGFDLSNIPLDSLQAQQQLNLNYLITFYRAYPEPDQFFNNFFDKLAGNAILRQQIIAGNSEAEIRATWQEGLAKFNKIRVKYLIYP